MSAPVIAPSEQRTVLRGVTWATYERLLAERGETSVPRLTYDRGVLEIMSPGKQHEILTRLIPSVLNVLSEEWDLPVTDLGSLTFSHKGWDRGFEPDGCFWVGEAAETVMRLEEVEPGRDPAPDVIVEVDISSSSIDKLALFARFGVGEVWRHDGTRVVILGLTADGYVAQERSRALPRLDAEHLTALLDDRARMASPAWLRHVRAWARAATT